MKGIGHSAESRVQQLAFSYADYDMPRARQFDPETSHQAAASAVELKAEHHGLILHALRIHGPLGKDGIGARTRLTGVQVCRRLDELQKAGSIVLTGKTVMSTAGRNEREWRAAA